MANDIERYVAGLLLSKMPVLAWNASCYTLTKAAQMSPGLPSVHDGPEKDPKAHHHISDVVDLMPEASEIGAALLHILFRHEP